jgi:hypothetical protein
MFIDENYGISVQQKSFDIRQNDRYNSIDVTQSQVFPKISKVQIESSPLSRNETLPIHIRSGVKKAVI